MSDIQAAVAKLYNTYPFPPDPLSDAPPPGYNWRWTWVAAHSFCTGRSPAREDIQILDAGCGTGNGTDYLVHLNPHAQVTAIDLSAGALAVARERCRRSGADRVTFRQMPLEEAALKLPGEFDLINCVGVLHHLPDPIAGIQSIAQKLAPGGLMHIFVYAALGRWEIQLMQEAIALLQGNKRGDYTDGVAVGRDIFATLPEQNPLVQRENERWSGENRRDECFADMYVHPQEVDYTIQSLFELIDASGLEFVGFSNPQFWQLERLLGPSSDLMARGQALVERDRYRLIELLDPKAITHYEFFLARPPFTPTDWADDGELLAAVPRRHPCLHGWPSRSLFNDDYELIQLSDAEFAALEACDGEKTVGQLVASLPLDLTTVRQLWRQRLLVLG
ncbi:class I SAM-dependent methyltransferase [Spirulina major CS-329]|uniref:class I SAM-dependent methyltransferase n=1 Tax=Spirulina TaxID=1154 RepID=UPI00232C8FE2|nr:MULTISPECIES: class I SAM-dependent methyltransferase [Spirulina]MDB9495570.1 class I SAM-dependent methyltransferase [Spirulina subsalsa CS-330]MDB9503921.1 class I SAM-dependent methyltransferase [Spirulina major CS-329]